jgi:ribosome-binding ATPase YchF (GTP1/OBG family)
MFIALIGAPNKGKSTLFNALTHGAAVVADYPFTTIDPNKGVAFVNAPCPHAELGIQCKPRHGSCVNGVRRIPVNVVDVAGLVPGAAEGKGRGNEFLNDLAAADALVCVIDAAGRTDDQGMPAPAGYDVTRDFSFIQGELDKWMSKVVEKNAMKAKGKKPADFAQYLSGLGLPPGRILDEVKKAGLPDNIMSWKLPESGAVLAQRLRKPIAIAANKMDVEGARANFEKIKAAFPTTRAFACSADVELALLRATEKGFVKYDGRHVEALETAKANPAIASAVGRLSAFVEGNNGTGVQALIDSVAFDLLNCIVVYPVEDEKRYSDHYGNVLPDAILLPQGSTPLDLAGKIHTDLAEGFLHAVNCRVKMRIGKDEPLKNGDIIKIVSSN